jgi:hypothetical protein
VTGIHYDAGVSRALLLPAALAAAWCCGGCLERTITVRSEPPGAVVWLNDQEIGRTPVTTGFRFYGWYELRLRKEGYEPVIAKREAVAPWYEYPGPDLFASAIPARIRTGVTWDFTLVPTPESEGGEEAESALLGRARAYRSEHSPGSGPPPTVAEPEPKGVRP